MELPDGTILLHAGRPYDPAKARAYYLRTRKLKGRKKKGSTFVVTDKNKGTIISKSKRKAKGVSKDPKLRKQRVNAAVRVAVLKKKLSQLNGELKKRMAEARKSEQESRKSAQEAKKPDTAAEKSKQARDAKQYRDKNQQKIATKAKQAAGKAPDTKESKTKKSGGEDSVQELKKTIERVQRSLAGAIAKQRALG